MGPLAELALRTISYYQTTISSRSIDRCPFKTSCSRYAVEAIQLHGAVAGMALFVDRNMYRENAPAYEKYDLWEDDEGVLKINDDFFLE